MAPGTPTNLALGSRAADIDDLSKPGVSNSEGVITSPRDPGRPFKKVLAGG